MIGLGPIKHLRMFSAAFKSRLTNLFSFASNNTPRKDRLGLERVETSCRTESSTEQTLEVRNSSVEYVVTREAHSLYARVVGTDCSPVPPEGNFALP